MTLGAYVMTSRQRSIRRELEERQAKKVLARERYWQKVLRKDNKSK